MAITHVQSTGIGSQGQVASISKGFVSNVTAGNLIVAGVAYYNQAIGSDDLSDDLSNTYTKDVTEETVTHKSGIFSAPDISGGSCTVTLTPDGNTYLNLVIAEFSGAATSSPLDASATVQDSGTDIDTGNLVTSDTDALFGICVHAVSNVSFTEDSPAGVVEIFEDDGDNNTLGTSGSYAIKTSGTYTMGWTLSSVASVTGCGAAYKPAAGALEINVHDCSDTMEAFG